jgi:hypothetical protein
MRRGLATRRPIRFVRNCFPRNLPKKSIIIFRDSREARNLKSDVCGSIPQREHVGTMNFGRRSVEITNWEDVPAFKGESSKGIIS